MTTNTSSIINANLDMFDTDSDTFDSDLNNTVFEIVNGGDFFENNKYAYGWAYEYEKDGVRSFGQVFHFYGSAEECAKQYGDMYDFFECAFNNGYELTGRVWFYGYFDSHYGIDEEGDFGEFFTKVQTFPLPR